MKIIIFRHYPLTEGPSMKNFADQIISNMRKRGHQVREITAPVVFGRLSDRLPKISKWLGYIDQFILFRWQLIGFSCKQHYSTLFVFTDQALGPWIAALKSKAHVVHVHDLLALQAAQRRQPFHHLSITGEIYQRWIYNSFRQAKYFLSVSIATRKELTAELQQVPFLNETLLNPLPPRFRPLQQLEATAEVVTALPDLGSRPFLFHIGRNWYKNRQGVLEIWENLCTCYPSIAPSLVLVGELEPELKSWLDRRSHLQNHLYVLCNPSNELVLALYSTAEALLFPSHAEGFGWPVLEALACGCPVITTNCPPMTEVGGKCAYYIPPAPKELSARHDWAHHAGRQVAAVLSRSAQEQQAVTSRGIIWAQEFSQQRWLDQLEAHYIWVLEHYQIGLCAG